LNQNKIDDIKTNQMGLFAAFISYMGKFFHINQKRIGGLNGFSVGVVAYYFCCTFFVSDWF
jgi:hypothetical protein